MDTVGERLKKIRKLRGWTQAYVSEKAGINAALYRQYECGDRTPKREAIEKIATALNLDVAFLKPTITDTPMALYALLFDLMDEFGDILIELHDGRVWFGATEEAMNNKFIAALEAHDKLSPEEFKKWLIDYVETRDDNVKNSIKESLT